MTAFGCGFCQVYGMTETTGAITALSFEDHDPDGPTARSPAFGRQAARVGGPADCGSRQRAGRGAGRGGGGVDALALQHGGLLGKPEETAATIDAEGWLKTGDAGYVDADGYLYLHDRIKDMIVSGGENIYPAEVENVLLSHPTVVDAAVIGVPDAKWGETVKAIVVLGPGETLRRRGHHRALPRQPGALQVPDLSRRHRTRCRATLRARSSSGSCGRPTGPTGSAPSTDRGHADRAGAALRPVVPLQLPTSCRGSTLLTASLTFSPACLRWPDPCSALPSVSRSLSPVTRPTTSFALPFAVSAVLRALSSSRHRACLLISSSWVHTHMRARRIERAGVALAEREVVGLDAGRDGQGQRARSAARSRRTACRAWGCPRPAPSLRCLPL